MNEEKQPIGDVAVPQLAYLDDNYFKTCEEFLDAAEHAVGENAALQHRIANERAVIDLSRVKRKGKISKDLPPGDEAVLDRLQKNWTAQLADYRYSGDRGVERR